MDMLDMMDMIGVKIPRIPSKSDLSRLVSVRAEIVSRGVPITLTPESLERIAVAGFRGGNLMLAIVAAQLLIKEKPITLRGLFYRVVSAGFLPGTDKQHYDRLGRLMITMREKELVAFSWLVDNMRSSVKPSSWTGLTDFADTIKDCYRKDYWAELPEYVHVIVEKDAIAAVIQPVTDEYDITLSPCRGYASLSFAHEIAETWNAIDKPIHAYFLGDYDPSGFDIERDIRAKLTKYCDHGFQWTRLGVNEEDFDEFNLLKLPLKHGDKRTKSFIREHGEHAAELDALPSTELRRRVQTAITSHINADSWQALREQEDRDKQTWEETFGSLNLEQGGRR